MSNGPVEPSADLRAAAKAVRGLFLALTAEGFTEAQALTIVRQVLQSSGGQQ